MKRKHLLELLKNYTPTNEEMLFKETMIGFIADHENCFDRSLLCGHITGSSWLLNKEKTHALMMHHAKLDQWFQPGGHCDGNPNVMAVAIQEAQEESGISSIIPMSNHIFDIDIHLIPENSKEKAHYHYDICFLLAVDSNEQITQNNESKELRWISKNIDELPTRNPSVVRKFNKWITQTVQDL